jgi:hypothetical protein
LQLWRDLLVLHLPLLTIYLHRHEVVTRSLLPGCP